MLWGVAQSPWFFPLITTLCDFGLSLVGNKATDGFRLEQPAGFDKGLGGDFVRAANVDGGVAVASINFHGHCGACVTCAVTESCMAPLLMYPLCICLSCTPPPP